ncbi:MAG: rhomboid family intramembrane serine protease [Actinomycetota bacterium]
MDPRHSTASTACYRHPDRPTRLACSECGRLICPECSRDAVVGQKCPECTTPEQRTRVIPARSITHVDRSATPVTWALIGINVVIFAVQELFPGLRIGPRAAQYSTLVDQGEWWRVLTAMFLHGGVLHLMFNMYALWLFGPVLERRFGSLSYAALYLAGGISGGMLFQLLGDGAAVGASGAIFGLLGALLAASYRQRQTRAGAAVFGQLGLLLAINLALPLFVRNIAWQAHVGGLLAGILIAAAWDRISLPGRTAVWRRLLVALAVGGAALALVLFV